MKYILAVIALSFSVSSFAENCASSISDLRELVGNPDAPLHWIENSDKKTLKLDISQADGVIRIKLTAPKGDWADMTGVVCETGPDSYVARLTSLKWGPQAPFLAKVSKVKQVKMELPHHDELIIKVPGVGSFSPR